MDNEVQYLGYQVAPNCNNQMRVDLSRATTRQLLYQMLESIGGLRDDVPDRFETLEEFIQGEASDGREMIEDLGQTLDTIQTSIEGIQEALETDDAVRDTLSTLEEQITDLQTWNTKLADDIRQDAVATHGRIQSLKEFIQTELHTQALAHNADTRSLRAEVQLLRRCIDTAPRFPQFRKLPPEIRTMIWDYATPHRLVCLGETTWEYDGHGFSTYKFSTTSLPPSTAQVCQESRAVACRYGRLMPIRNLLAYPIDITPPNKKPLWCKTQWGWFDPSRDSLHLQPTYDHLRSLETISDLTRCAEHVTLDCGTHTKWINYFHLLFSPIHFPCIKAVDLVAGRFVLAEFSDPVLEARLFGQDRKRPVTVDIDDKAGIADLLAKLRKNHTSVDIDNLEEVMKRIESLTWSNGSGNRGVSDWRRWSKRFPYEYIIAKYLWYPLAGKGLGDSGLPEILHNKPGLSEDWFLTIVPGIPKFRRVALLRVGPWDGSNAE
ncbi:hypothetical protein M426DRAFT_319885 [Hypoxylon sp. CI-4A]|nr:hypothetical protein M426DRAFT_319885 [Hypoxylon sp. CI-4A]